MFRTTLRTVTSLLLLLCLSLVAQANTIRVPADQPSLAAALGTAAEGDTILLADGIYSESQLAVDNKGVTIQSESGNPNACILDTTQVEFASDASHVVTIRGLTFRNFWDHPIVVSTFNSLEAGYTLTISNCIFSNNSFGIQSFDSDCVLTVTHCTFKDGGGINMGLQSAVVSDCAFTGSGMSITSSASLAIARCNFTQSTVWVEAEGDSATITDSTFDHVSETGNTISSVTSSPCLIKNCAFTNNTHWTGALLLSGNTFITGCTFANNAATQGNFGGAVMDWGGSLMIANSLFIHNTADQGGAVASSDSMTLLNCTFVSNQAVGGGNAVYHDNAGNPSGGLHIANCLFWGNSSPAETQIQDPSDPSLVQLSNNLIQDYPGLIGAPDAHGNFTANPLFVRNPSPGPDGQWGTDDDDLGDLHLLFGSPAINAGANALLPPDIDDLDNDGNTTESLPLDLDENPRIHQGTVDLGAYEYQATEVSGSVSIKAGGFTAAGGTNYTQTLTLTNTGTAAINGPIYFVLDSLGGTNVQLTNPSGTTFVLTPGARPYLTLSSSLPAQASVKVTLKFSNPSKTLISYTPHLFAGMGSP